MESSTSELINIQTTDLELEELMLKEYPGRLFEKNIRIKKRMNKMFFSYLGLEKRVFEQFISKYEGKFTYQTTRFLGFPSESKELDGVSLN